MNAPFINPDDVPEFNPDDVQPISLSARYVGYQPSDKAKQINRYLHVYGFSNTTSCELSKMNALEAARLRLEMSIGENGLNHYDTIIYDLIYQNLKLNKAIEAIIQTRKEVYGDDLYKDIPL